jgi:hypothetical protein
MLPTVRCPVVQFKPVHLQFMGLGIVPIADIRQLRQNRTLAQTHHTHLC